MFSFQALQSDIELRKKNVDQAISNGMELLKQTTGMSDFMTFIPQFKQFNTDNSVSVTHIIRFLSLFWEHFNSRQRLFFRIVIDKNLLKFNF